jgi:hypothetical protein
VEVPPAHSHPLKDFAHHGTGIPAEPSGMQVWPCADPRLRAAWPRQPAGLSV